MNPTDSDADPEHRYNLNGEPVVIYISTALDPQVFYNHNHLISPNNFYLFTWSLSERLLQSKQEKKRRKTFFSRLLGPCFQSIIPNPTKMKKGLNF